MFDSFLVGLMVWETWIQVLLYKLQGSPADSKGPGGPGRSSSVLRIFRIARLTRVARTVKLLHSMPELLILVKGMTVAMRSVIAILCLLLLTIYIFACVFVQLLAGSPAGAG